MIVYQSAVNKHTIQYKSDFSKRKNRKRRDMIDKCPLISAGIA